MWFTDGRTVPDERKAREVANFRQAKLREQRLARQQAKKLDSLFDQIPGQEFFFSSFTVEIKGRIESDIPAGGLQAAAFGKQW